MVTDKSTNVNILLSVDWDFSDSRLHAWLIEIIASFISLNKQSVQSQAIKIASSGYYGVL